MQLAKSNIEMLLHPILVNMFLHKSIPGFCEKPWATICALYLTILPFLFCFCAKTHMYSMSFSISSLWTTGPKIIRLVSKYNYASIASFHFNQSFLCQQPSMIIDFLSSLSLITFIAILYAKVSSMLTSYFHIHAIIYIW